MGSSAEAVCARLADDGYAVVEGLLAPEPLARARAETTAIFESTPFGRDAFEGHKTRRIYALFANAPAFDGPATDPLILGVLDRVLHHYQLSAPTGIQIGPGETAQPMHPDDAIYPVARPHDELVVNVMWPLDDFTAENGATRIVRGSHRWGADRYPGPDDDVTVVEMPAGSALLYVGSIWHGGGANRTDRPRAGVVLHYAASWLRPVENHVLAVAPDVVRTLPTRMQALGYNIGPPFIGYVDGRHPRHTLDR